MNRNGNLNRNFEVGKEYFDWNYAHIPVQYRVEFKDLAGVVQQVWYYVKFDTPYITPTGDPIDGGWIAARIGDKFYIEGLGVTEKTDPCKGYVGAPTTYTFYYSRETATNYAIRQAYQNNILDPRRFGQRRISTFIPAVPFADIHYDRLDGTDSAFFTSEVIWMGGMPMTTANTVECDAALAGNYNFDGWRHCLEIETRWGTTTWNDHVGILGYFIENGVAFSWVNVFDDIDPNNPIPVSRTANNNLINGGGFVVRNTRTDTIFFDLSDLRASGIMLNFQTDQIEAGDDAELHAFAESKFTQIVAGDYMFVNSGRKDPSSDNLIESAHGFIIAGWGTVSSCEDAIQTSDFKLYNPATDTLGQDNLIYTTQSQAPDTTVDGDNLYIVPYVVDYSGPPDSRVQTPVPRPFYCSKYPSPNKFNDRHGWHFFHLPDVVGLNNNSLYTLSDWQWDGSTAR
jgi:hypothetical protein